MLCHISFVSLAQSSANGELNASSNPEFKQTYSIAINQTSYPYHFENEQGQPDGIMVDLWKLWAKKQGVNIEFKHSNWQATIDHVKQGDIDIHAGLMATEKRSDSLAFTRTFFKQNSYVIVHRDLNISTIEQLLPYTIGIVKGSSHIEHFIQLHPKLNIRTYENRFALFDAALRGEIVAFTNLDKLSNNYPRHQEIQTEFPLYKRMEFHQGNYVGAVARKNAALLTFVEQGLEKITAQEKSAIEKKWLGVDKKNNVLVLAFTPELPPYMAISPTGMPQGLFIDIWRLWSEQMGLKIEFVPIAMTDAVEIINQGGADIHIAYPEVSQVMNALLVAHQVYSVASNVFVSNRIPNITHIAELAGKKVGVFDTAPYKNSIIEQFPEVEFISYKGYSNILKAAELGEVDAMIGAVENMNAQLIQVNMHSAFYRLKQNAFTANIFTLTQKNNTRLAEMIREGFALIPIEKLIQLEKKWLSDDSYGFYNMNATQVTLSLNEQHFIEEHNEIKIGLTSNWKPVEFVDDNGNVQGINPDITQLVSQRTGLNFSYVKYDNWQDMFKALQRNEIDMLASATSTEERKQQFLFSDSYWDMPWVVIHQRQEGNNFDIKDFYGKELAIVKGYHLINRIRTEHPNVSLRLVDDHNEGILAVQQGAVFGLIENIASASELIKRESLVTLNMSIIDEFNVDKDSYAIRKDWPYLKSIIDKALMTITDAEKQKIYEKWFDINIETGFDKSTVLRVSVQIGVIILVVITVIVIWNRRLYIEIKTRKRLEEKMKHMATHDELTGLANRVLLKDRIKTAINFHQRQALQMAVLFIDLDGFKTVNDSYGHDVGDELLLQVANRLANCVRQSDTIVRFGGDEFVLLLTGLHNKDEAAFVGDKVLKLIREKFCLSVAEVNIGCSIGIAMYPDDGLTDTDLLKEADTLMYQVKASGKNHYVFKS